jgi:hypothetical protein
MAMLITVGGFGSLAPSGSLATAVDGLVFFAAYFAIIAGSTKTSVSTGLNRSVDAASARPCHHGPARTVGAALHERHYIAKQPLEGCGA